MRGPSECLHPELSCLPQFRFVFKAEDEKNGINVTFARRTSIMPQPPKVGPRPPATRHACKMLQHVWAGRLPRRSQHTRGPAHEVLQAHAVAGSRLCRVREANPVALSMDCCNCSSIWRFRPWQATKHHPSSVDLELIKRLASSTASSTLTSFLSKEFDCISRDLAGVVGVGIRGGWPAGRGAAPGAHSAQARAVLVAPLVACTLHGKSVLGKALPHLPGPPAGGLERLRAQLHG